jgi:hypothetical protein
MQAAGFFERHAVARCRRVIPKISHQFDNCIQNIGTGSRAGNAICVLTC